MKDKSNLTHHEQLRYDYLYKNYHYLNDREKEELTYLTRKMDGAVPQQSEHLSQTDGAEESRYTRQACDNSSLLPRFPGKEKKQKPKVSKTSRISEENQAETASPKKPRKKMKIKRILFWIAALLLAVLAGMVFMFVRGLQSGKEANPKAAQTEVFNGSDTKDGVNILILGTDGRVGQTSGETRTDSIMVLNVGNKDHKVKLVSFMRDTLVHIDGVSQEDGYNTYYDQKLNVAYAIGEQSNHQGADLVRQVLKDSFDIDIKYYALVDFSTFATAIDTLFPEGVEMDAKFSTVNGVEVKQVEVPDDLNMKDGVVPNQTIKVGKQRMDGRTLLNYARFRKDDEGDFGRARRQQEVISAIVSQVKNPTKLFTGSEAIGKVFAMTSTNIPYSFLLSQGVNAVTSGQNGVERVTVPENGDWVDDYDMYGGQGLFIDFEQYKRKLSQIGLR